MHEPQQVTKQVYIVGSSQISHDHDCSVYLVDAGQLVLIDSGAGASFQRLGKNIRTLGFKPENIHTVIATHCHIDHVGALGAFRQAHGAGIVAHALDAEDIETGGKGVLADLYGADYEPCVVDRKLEGEENTLSFKSFDMKVVHIPGHTPGSIAVYFDDPSGKRILFGQDVHGPYNPEWGADRQQARASLEKLISLNADILCEGHFGVYEPAARVKKYIEGFLANL